MTDIAEEVIEIVTWDHERSLFIVVGMAAGNAYNIATSPDGVTWELNPDGAPDALSPGD